MAASPQKISNAVGKRKSAIARVLFRPAKGAEGKIIVNGRGFENYFPRDVLRRVIMQPLEVTDTVGKYDIEATVSGGGDSGQAGALRHGIARSLNALDREIYRKALKAAGYLTRDSRKVERKKYGMAGARKRFQFSKR
jgi:small subunit ribosomal protein S9